MIRVWTIPFSTNGERVALGLGHKGLEAEVVEVRPEDRSEVMRVSGQELVPVAEIHGEVVADSTAILRRLEELRPDPPLWPAAPARRAELDVFVDWFNAVWKVAPNAIAAELERDEPDVERVAELTVEMARDLDRFEALLDRRPYLFGDALSAADCIAFPFLKYAGGRDPADDELFHRVLEDSQPLGERHPRLAAWIERVARHPRAF